MIDFNGNGEFDAFDMAMTMSILEEEEDEGNDDFNDDDFYE